LNSSNSTVEIFRSNNNASIFRVYPDFLIRKYTPGQYGSLGLLSKDGNKLIKRAYSISSPIIDINSKNLIDQRHVKYLEFYINRVYPKNKKTKERLTPKLFALKDGDRLFCGEKIVGHYIFDLKRKWDNILLISSHTGESPNNSIVNQLLLANNKINICNINCGSELRWESLYSDEHQLIKKKYNNYKFINFINNSMFYEELTKFIKEFCELNSKATKKVGFKFDKNNLLVMLCGDPFMIGAPIKKGAWEYSYPKYGLVKIFKKYSLKLTTRFQQGSIIFESYW